ncbi:MAG: hypothetical protein Kow0069_31360 [Promethearchaeota archaeon]
MFYVAFDESHKPRGKITSNYRNLHRHLENTGQFQVFSLLEFPITRASLQSYDVLVFPCPDFSKLSPQEIAEVTKWVKEDGGGLLILSHAGGDKGRNSNLSELAERFGCVFESDQVLDPEHNFGIDNMPEVTNFQPHPVTEGIESLCYRAGCSLTVVGTSAMAVAFTGETAEPFSTPIVVAAESEEGRVVCCGSYEIFRDRIGGGFNHGQHAQFAENIFKWLVTDKRRKLRAGAGAPKPTAPTGPPSVGPLFTGEEQPVGPVPAGGTVGGAGEFEIEVESHIHVGDRSEFGVELTKILMDFQKVTARLQALISAVMTTPDIQELRAAAPADGGGVSPPSPELGWSVGAGGVPPAPASPEDLVAEISQVGSQELPPAGGPSLTPPPEPPGASTSSGPTLTPPPEPPAPPAPPPPPAPPEFPATEEQGAQPEETTSEIPEFPQPEPEPEVTLADLEAELESLKSKLISINDLKKFVEKKRAAGKITDKQYEKQVKKFEADIKKTQYRIEELEARIKKMKS